MAKLTNSYFIVIPENVETVFLVYDGKTQQVPLTFDRAIWFCKNRNIFKDNLFQTQTYVFWMKLQKQPII